MGDTVEVVDSTAVASEFNLDESGASLGDKLDDFFQPEIGSADDASVPPVQTQTRSVPVVTPDEAVPRPTWRDRRVAGRLRARKVRRLVRHIEPWSVLKIALLFNFCLWIIFMIAGVMMWNFAEQSDTLDNVENFIEELFALEDFQFDGEQIFERSALGGLVLVVALTGFAVLMAVLFNLISDLTGGLRLTVIEEETARVFTPPDDRAESVVSAGPSASALPPDTSAVQ